MTKKPICRSCKKPLILVDTGDSGGNYFRCKNCKEIYEYNKIREIKKKYQDAKKAEETKKKIQDCGEVGDTG